MSLTVVSRPSTSQGIPAANNIVYRFYRKDYASNSLSNSGGKIRIVVTGDLTALIAVGDSLWFKSDNGTYDLLVTVFTITYSAPDTTITFNESYTSAATTGYINLYSRKQYNVEIQVIKNSTGLDLMDGVTMTFSPDKKGQVTANLLALKNYLAGDYEYTWSGNPNAIEYNVPFVDSVGTVAFYIKYKENWVGSSNSYTSDSANVVTMVQAANQAGEEGVINTGYLGLITNKKIFSNQHHPTLLSAFLNSPLSFGFVKVGLYDVPGASTHVFTGFKAFAASTEKSIVHFPFHYYNFKWIFYTRETGAGTSWGTLPNSNSLSINLGAGATTKKALALCYLATGQSITLTTTCTLPGSTSATIYLLNSAGGVITSSALSNGSGSVTLTSTGADTYFIAIDASNASGGSLFILILTQLVLPTVSVPNITIQLTDVSNAIPYVQSGGTDMASAVYMESNPISQNLINLVWRNSKGGFSNWIFYFNQEFSYNYANKKNKRFTLFADRITDDQFDALEEVNTIGEIFEVPYDEFSNIVRTLHKREGANVYMNYCTGLSDAGDWLYGVVVIPTQNRIQTRRLRNAMQLTIEMPEVISI